MASINQPLEAPRQPKGLLRWVLKNLFNNWYNSIITIASFYLIVRFLIALAGWVAAANWDPVISRPILYAVGQYPLSELWRVGVALAIVSLLAGMSWGVYGGVVRTFALLLIAGSLIIMVLPANIIDLRLSTRVFFLANVAFTMAGYGLGRTSLGRSAIILPAWALSFVVITLLLRGFPGTERLPVVETTLWGGLLVNLLLAAVGIGASFPLGVLLALGRRSSLPIVKLFCTLYIELIRGVPLVSILFMASIILPLFLPENIRIDRMLRALIGIIMFSSAYMAENVRGGLQAIPLGQFDAAKAIGLSGMHTMLLIILPQALRKVIPAIVGQFISLFKDTTLVLIVAILEILGIGKSIVSGNPEWTTHQAEVYIFVALVFWVFTYTMSYSSRRLEKQLGVGIR